VSILVDANILLYAVDARSPHHRAASTWMESALNGTERVAFAWESIGAFLRIVTHPRVVATPLDPRQAWQFVADWLDADPSWIPTPTLRTFDILGSLLVEHHATGNLVPDAMLAALAIEHGLAVCTADSDFVRFPVRVVNPLDA